MVHLVTSGASSHLVTHSIARFEDMPLVHNLDSLEIPLPI
jgi:hypothetical protein